MVRVYYSRKQPVAIITLLPTKLVSSIAISVYLRITNISAKHLLFFFSLLLSLNCYSDITILASDSSRNIGIAKRIQEKITVESSIKNSFSESEEKNSIIITIGSTAFYKVADKSDSQIIASFIPHATNIDHKEDSIFPYYSEPSPNQISSFFSKHFNSAKIGILYDDSDIRFIENLKKAFDNSDNTLIAIKHNKKDVFDSIRALIKKDIDIMLITKNRDIYHPKKIRFVIEALSRKRIPTITTSTSLLRAGSAVSITPDEEQTIIAIANLANQLHKDQKITDDIKGESKNITVNINKSMMKLFNLNIDEGSSK